MSKQIGLTAELLLLSGQMRDQTITPNEAARLSEILSENKAARQFYLKFMSLTAALEASQCEDQPSHAGDAPENDLSLLLDLLQMEQNAPVQPELLVSDTNADIRFDTTANAPSTAARIDRGLALYIARHAMRSKPARWLATAAVLTLGIFLAVHFIGPATAPTPNALTDNTPSEPVPVGEALNTPVATLTNTHNAQWAEGALAPGSALNPSQRLTLTAGFAEITTAHGAVAILQAPSTIELTHNPNAMYLHAGKLVGICETPSSKGFTVQTATLNITDLGTRFGVEVADDRQTEVHVAVGEVSVRVEGADANASTSEPRLLRAGDAARISPGDRQITRMDADTQRFVAMQPIQIELPGTGKGLSAGAPDPNWAIVSFEGQTLQTPRQPKVNNNRNYQNLFPNDPATSQWLAWDETTLPARPARPAGTYTRHLFQTTVTLPDEIDPATAKIVLNQVADSRVDAILVNGQRINLNLSAPDPKATWRSTEVIDQHLVAGENTIGFEVLNRYDELGKAGFVGLRIQWQLQGYASRSNRFNDSPIN